MVRYRHSTLENNRRPLPTVLFKLKLSAHKLFKMNTAINLWAELVYGGFYGTETISFKICLSIIC